MFEPRPYVVFLRNQGERLDDKFKNPWKHYVVQPEEIHKLLSFMEVLLSSVDKAKQADIYTRLDEISKW